MTINADQLRAARALLKLGSREIASLAGIDKMTIVRIENGGKAYVSTMDKLQTALEEVGIHFIPAVDGVHGPGVALKAGFVPTAKQAGEGDVSESEGTSSSPLKAWDWNEHSSNLQPLSAPEAADLRRHLEKNPALYDHLSSSGKAVIDHLLSL